MNFQKLFKEEITTVSKIEEGFSEDQKYLINNKYLVRVLALNRVERFKKVLDFQRKFSTISMCQKPLDLIIDTDKAFYITEYLPGENGLEVIHTYSTQKQYDLGLLTGKELSKVHKVLKDPNFNTKEYLDNYLYTKSNLVQVHGFIDELPELGQVIKIVEDNIHKLYHLEGLLVHSDYHLFNMIFDKGEYKGVIDFERCASGIFLRDMRNNTPHNSSVSPHFASGFIDGYLNEISIENFFTLYNLHDLLVTVSALPWVKQFNPDNLETEKEKIKNIFNHMNSLDQPPVWYIGKYK